jgi:flavin-dependent dehydrogenase
VSGKFLSVYEKRWKDEVGKELKNGYRLRKMYTGMSDRDLNKIFSAADNSNIKEILNGGDIDHPSDLLMPLMKDIVTAVRLTPLMLKAAVRSMK